jgi:hypothetical protein
VKKIERKNKGKKKERKEEKVKKVSVLMKVKR